MQIFIFMLTTLSCTVQHPPQTKLLHSYNLCLTLLSAIYFDLKLVLNADKTMVMLFSNTKPKLLNLPSISTSQGSQVEVVGFFF